MLVVVVNYCFTSLFGTNGLLIDNLIRIQLMKCECTDDDVRVGVMGHGGLLRAFSFTHPIRGSGHV